MQIAASLEQGSEHPLAKAVLAHALEMNIPTKQVSDFNAIPGGGVTARINTCEYVLGSPKFLIDHGVLVFITSKSQHYKHKEKQ